MKKPNSSPWPQPDSRGAWALYAAVVLLVALLNIATAPLYPLVWQDEVYYTDPAVTLAQTGHLRSTAWWHVSSQNFWFGYVQLHELLLAVWLQILPLSITAVRSISFLYVSVATLLLLAAFLRVFRPRSIGAPLLLIGLLLTGDGMAFMYRSGRGDALALLLVAMFSLSLTLNNSLWRHTLLATACIGLPWTSLPSCLAVVVICVWYRSRLPRKDLLESMFFAGFGSLLLAGYLSWNGVLVKYLFFLLGGKVNILGHILQTVFYTGPNASWSSVLVRLSSTLSFLYDPEVRDLSYLVLIGAAILCIWIRQDVRFVTAVRVGSSALFMGILLVLIIAVIGEPRKYYSWLAFVPVAIGTVGLLANAWTARRSYLRWGIVISCVSAMLVGLPLRLTESYLSLPCRDYQLVENLVAGSVRVGDVVYADWAASYALWKLRIPTYYISYSNSRFIPDMDRSEKQSISLMILTPGEVEDANIRIAGSWNKIAEVRGPLNECGGKEVGYHLVALRRAGEVGSSN